MATRDADYTRTGNGWLTSLANKASFIPGVGFITGTMVFIDSTLSAIGWAFRGKFGSAAATLGSGTLAATSHAVSALPGIGLAWWGANALSGVTTGRSAHTHIRAFSETATSFVTRPLGVQPTVLRSHFAGIGGTGGAMMPQGPGRFATQVANERGQNAQDMHNNYMRGEGGVHVNQLSSAYGRGA